MMTLTSPCNLVLEDGHILSYVSIPLCLMSIAQRLSFCNLRSWRAFSTKLWSRRQCLLSSCSHTLHTSKPTAKQNYLLCMQAINPQAELIECNLATAPPQLDNILGLQSFNLSRILERDSNFLKVIMCNRRSSPYSGYIKLILEKQ